MNFIADLHKHLLRPWFCAIVIVFLLLLMLTMAEETAQAAAGDVALVSSDASGVQGNGSHNSASISADGRYVAFASSSTNLVSGVTGTQVYRKDLQTGQVLLVSCDAGNVAGNNTSSIPSISADGRFVAFWSAATNLVSLATSNYQIFRKDLQTDEVKLASCDSLGSQGDNNSYGPSMNSDGRYVTFASIATDLVSPPTSNQQVFRKDLQTGAVMLCTSTAGGVQGNANSTISSLTPDGRYVAIQSNASNLVSPATSQQQVFRKDLQTGAVNLASSDASGNEPDGASYSPAISSDGRYVVFGSYASDLVPGGTSNSQAFRKDLQSGEVMLVSSNKSGEAGDSSSGDRGLSMSLDSRYVAFTSYATNLVPMWNGKGQVLRKDTATGQIAIVSCDISGTAGDDSCGNPSISADGMYVAFQSNATNLVSPVTSQEQIFRKELLPAPSITSVDPTSGLVGSEVTIIGTDFGGSQGSSYVSFGTLPAISYSSWSDTEIRCLVPAGAVGPLSLTVTTLYGTSNEVDFTATSAFFFAEGYTGEGFQEYLCLGQPANTPLEVTVTYLFRDGSSKVEAYSVPANSRFTVNVNGVVGKDKEVSMKCEADFPFIAERPMYFDYTGGGAHWTGGHDVVGATRTSDSWYFAEGYTGAGFDEWICVLNPGNNPADLTFRFQTQEEGEKTVAGIGVPAHSRQSFKANDLLGGGSYQTSLKLESSQPVVAERPMYFSYSGTGGWNWTGGHCVMGASTLEKEYYFAEGTTRKGFEEWLTLQNPSLDPIAVNATYLLASGDPVAKSYTVDPAKRSTIYVPGEVGKDQDVSVYLYADSPFLAERPMYFSYSGLGNWGWTGGHCVIGATAQATDWFFAEGYTGNGFEEWLCIQNPGTAPANVTITYLPEGGTPIVKDPFTVAANSRFTVPVNTNAGAGLAICAKVVSDQPVIVERPMYFNFQGKWSGGHDVVGYTP